MRKTVIPMYHCPNKRPAQLYNGQARSDYAINIGSVLNGNYASDGVGAPRRDRDGNFEKITIAKVTDGTSQTLMFGEKQLNFASMAGTIEGLRTSKVALAKDAVRRGLTKVGPQTRVGLVAFGHRRGDCGDVELMRPLEPLDAQRLGEALDRMNPRGRGPKLQRRGATRLPRRPPGRRPTRSSPTNRSTSPGV